ncbi:tetratricopeptide repeat protein [Phycobacter azelaicus]|jgi:Tfp pilus assembly protein PilF|uniref:tetratricopeptide repeat protein n=1 Tax=Phycobacter azelaicus TaxID=2668075 RepID=UPI0018672F65|nr:tetratricopeptide repeat protein [Phycobacter azelaicus]MBE1296282.1 tetratricopeptide repeat protein [Paracoccaceae bacterium]
MRQFILVTTGLVGVLALSACVKPDGKETVERAFEEVNVVDAHNLNEVMLTVADPNEAVSYFQKSLKSSPDRIDFQRGLATSLIRAKRNTEAAGAWKKVAAHSEATVEDRISLADALIRVGDWKGAEDALDSVPPTHETYRRYRLEAMVADANKEWKRADSFYEIATGLTTQPAKVMNNWGYSKLSRGQFAEAERLFSDAIRQDPTLFTAKNNLVLARGAQRNYTLPVIPLDQTERAQLLHTMALSAVKQGDVKTGENLLREALATHPQHFEAAARSLAALENG